MTEEIMKNEEVIKGEEKIIAAVGYLGPFCFVPLMLKKESSFAQFHGKQGLILFIFWIIFWFVGLVPFVGWIISFLANISIVILAIIGVLQSLAGKYWKIPYLSEYAEKIKL
jgi:uncharacterized membrane protein